MITAGIDLAAAPRGTAVAHVDWRAGPAVVTDVVVGADDDALVAVLRGSATKVGIDSPLGWPSDFVAFVTAHHQDEVPFDAAEQPRWKVPLVNRATDLHVRQQVGLVPLSVSADLIGHTALRCATVLAQARVRGVDVRRDGAGTVAEVYPAAALKQWGLPHRGYKGRALTAARAALVTALQEAAPWLDLGDHEPTVRASDHALDAVVGALVARAVALGRTAPPDTRMAAREGWIHYPTGPLRDLVATD